jgi:hypothetical protein
MVSAFIVIQENAHDATTAWSTQLRLLDFLWIWRDELLVLSAGAIVFAFCVVRLFSKGRRSASPMRSLDRGVGYRRTERD